jgi:hypothetical protein
MVLISISLFNTLLKVNKMISERRNIFKQMIEGRYDYFNSK